MPAQKKWECTSCGKKYLSRKPNFSNNKQYKSGYTNTCKTCARDNHKKWMNNKSDEELETVRVNNVEYQRGRVRNGKRREYDELVRLQTRARVNKNNAFSRLDEKLYKYVKKFYWEEKRTMTIDTIKPWEL